MALIDLFQRLKPRGPSIKARARDQRQEVAAECGDWRLGHTLLEEFVVDGLLGEGGMGKVYLVKSHTTGTCFAVKRAKGLNENDRRNFLAELKTWIDLPEHPNLVPCRFFRTAENEVLIFADYVQGGSLKNWIDSRKLYEGGAKAALERVIDTAIQFAWGLQCLHELGLVHQDVKPANALIEKHAHAVFCAERQNLKFVTRFVNGNTQRSLTIPEAPTLAQLDAASRHIAESGDQFSPDERATMERQIQVAWCDLKGPRVRVTDYGLMRARRAAGEKNVSELARSILVSSGGYTPAYCSPEQARGRKLDRRTDVWSWGVSVLEMFQGGVTWRSGTVAAEALAAFLDRNERKGILPMPEDIVELLKGCFRDNPEERWKSMEAVVRKLKSAYQAAVGAEYSRPLSNIQQKSAPRLAAHERRSRSGVSWTDPQEWLERASRAEGRRPGEAEETAARHRNSRRGQLVDDIAMYDEARRIYERLIKDGGKNLQETLAALCQEAALVHETADDFSGASALYDRAIDILERLVNGGQHELAKSLVSVYLNKGIVLKTRGNNREAIGLYDRAIALAQRVVRQSDGCEGITSLANIHMNKANILTNLGEYEMAVAAFDLAIQILELAVGAPNNRKELIDSLATAYLNKAIALNAISDNTGAVALCDRALDIFETLVNQQGRRELSDALSAAYINKAMALMALRDNDGAVSLYDRAIEINTKLVNQEGRRELLDTLANAHQNKAAALMASGENKKGAVACDPAISIYERLVNQEGRRELSDRLSRVYLNKGIALQALADDAGAVRNYDRALQITERLVNSEGRREFSDHLANIYKSKAGAIFCMGDEAAGLSLFDRAIQIRERLVNTEGRQELAHGLAKTYVNKAIGLNAIGDNPGVVAAYDSAIQIYEKLIDQRGRNDLMGELAAIKDSRAKSASAILSE
jgi:serine/threonine protein kinase